MPKNEDDILDEKNQRFQKKGDKPKSEFLEKEMDYKVIKKIINVKEEPKMVKGINEVKKIEEPKVIKNEVKKVEKKDINKEYSFIIIDSIYNMHLKIYIQIINIMKRINILLLL